MSLMIQSSTVLIIMRGVHIIVAVGDVLWLKVISPVEFSRLKRCVSDAFRFLLSTWLEDSEDPEGKRKRNKSRIWGRISISVFGEPPAKLLYLQQSMVVALSWCGDQRNDCSTYREVWNWDKVYQKIAVITAKGPFRPGINIHPDP